jgi:hypothetical protein
LLNWWTPSDAASVFPSGADRRATTEVLALRLAGGLAGVPVATVVLEGPLADHGGRFILLTRLPGVRWADRRSGLDPGHQKRLVRDVGNVLRRLHCTLGERFGGMLSDDPQWSAVWAQIKTKLERSVANHVAQGGSVDLAERVRSFVFRHRELFGPALRPASATMTERRKHPGVGCRAAAHHAYGLSSTERRRLEVHVVLLALAERIWIVEDRPAGWADSAAALEDLLLRST